MVHKNLALHCCHSQTREQCCRERGYGGLVDVQMFERLEETLAEDQETLIEDQETLAADREKVAKDEEHWSDQEIP